MTTGLVLPAKELCALAKLAGAFSIVDGAHAPGMIPLNLREIDPDFYGGNCHKWMMAPLGCGFLYVARRVRHLLSPLLVTWGDDCDESLYCSDEPSPLGGSRWQARFEFHGTADRAAQCVLPELFAFRDSIGEARIQSRARETAGRVRDILSAVGLKCATPANPSLCGAITAFDFPVTDLVAARNTLYEKDGVECPFTITFPGNSGAPRRTFLRVSTPWWTTDDELRRLRDAVIELRNGM